MVVTHLLQILGIVALEPPSRIDAEALHLERTKLFEAIRPLDRERVVFGQYDGYRDEDGRRRRLQTWRRSPRIEVWVDTWRWSGVPFYLRTGKSLAEGRRTVTIGFSDAPLRIFPNQTPEQLRPAQRAGVRALRRPQGPRRGPGQGPRAGARPRAAPR